MSARKLRPAERLRPPIFVDRESGAAELCVTVETWDAMVLTGELPPATLHLRSRLPRWRWADVEAWLSGDRRPPAPLPDDETPTPAAALANPFVEAVRKGQARPR
jgi:hypothetical protein